MDADDSKNPMPCSLVSVFSGATARRQPVDEKHQRTAKMKTRLIDFVRLLNTHRIQSCLAVNDSFKPRRTRQRDVLAIIFDAIFNCSLILDSPG